MEQVRSIQVLSAKKRALFKKTIRQTSPNHSASLIPSIRDGHQYFPLSFAQQRIWMFDQITVGKTVYHIPHPFCIKGKLNIQALSEALSAMVKRHEVLRTAFVTVQSTPMQCIQPPTPIEIPFIDLRSLDAPQRQAQSQHILEEEALKRFDLSAGLVVRPLLLQLADDDFIFMATFHHIAFDGWSADIFQKEMVAFYHAFHTGSTVELPALSLRYADYAAWQRQQLQGSYLVSQLEYWKQHLANLPGPLELPIDHPRPVRQTFNGRDYPYRLSHQLTQELKELAQQTDTTLYMVLMAALQIFLCRHCNQEDFLVGMPISNRLQSELEPIIGVFFNTLPIHANLTGNPSFKDLLQRVKAETLGAYQHLQAPLDLIAKTVQFEHSLIHSPLFRVILQFQNTPVSRTSTADLGIDSLKILNSPAKYEFYLQVKEEGFAEESSLEVIFSYNTDLFDDATIQRFAPRFQRLLEAIVANPEEHVWQLPLIPEQEDHFIASLNDTYHEVPAQYAGLCMHQFVEVQVMRTPDEIALVNGERKLTYAQVNRLANRLAHRLRQMGVGPETIVGLCLPRSPELIIALLAILKAGGAYLPLDPAYPSERLRFQVQDADIHILITNEDLERLWKDLETPRVHLDQYDFEEGPANWDTNLDNQTQEDNLAYIIYTSGSTGKPKGVCIMHGNAGELIRWGLRIFTPAELKGMVSGTSICFDISVFEIFVPWSCGGTVYLVENGLQLPTGENRQNVTFLDLVSSVMAELLRNTTIPTSVRVINLCGEVLPRPLVEKLYELPHVERINNLYGPSEDTTYSTWSPQTRDDHSPNVPIGRPIDNTQIYLLDRYKQPVPFGVVGEIYLGGAGVTRGYLNRPELTRERYLPDTFGSQSGGRLYRSGDMARYRQDGQLEFVARIDNQVKIRGYRIELGEIESVLHQHPDVQESAILARKDIDPSSPVLVAYMRRSEQSKAWPEDHTIKDVRAFLRERLPNHMVPAFFVILESLPHTSTGKIDRSSLPMPDLQHRQREDLVAPRDEIELRIVRIWENLLQVAPISIHDDFFELGVSSLLAVRLMARIKNAFQQDLSLAVLLNNPTPEKLAAILRHQQGQRTRPALVDIQPAGNRPPLFCVHPVGGEVFCYIDLARNLGPEQPFYGLQVTDLQSQQETAQTLEEMAQAYIAEIRRIQPNGPYWLIGWSMGGVIAFEMAQQLTKQGDAIAYLALIDSEVPMEPQADASSLLQQFSEDLDGLFSHRLQIDYSRLNSLDQHEQLRQIHTQAIEANILPSELQADDLWHLFTVYKNNSDALGNYHPAIYNGPVTLFAASKHTLQQREQIEHWQAYVSQELTLHTIPGNHYDILKPPALCTLTEQLRKDLESIEDTVNLTREQKSFS